MVAALLGGDAEAMIGRATAEAMYEAVACRGDDFADDDGAGLDAAVCKQQQARQTSSRKRLRKK